MNEDATTASGAGPPDPERPNLQSEFAVGSKVGDYTLVEYISSGGMGDVYEARLVDHERLSHARFALKLANVNLRDEEAEVLQRLNHPNIVRLHDAGEVIDAAGTLRQYVVLQLLEGASRVTHYADSHRLSTVERVQLGVTACEALEYALPIAHHLDVKPSNLLVDRFGTLYVCDFGGASRRADSTPELGLLTPEYCAPEQLLRTKANLDERADVYALAVTLFELLTGVLPIDVDRNGSRQNIAAMKERKPRSFLDHCTDCDSRLDAILSKALEYDTASRTASLRDFRESLQQWIQRTQSPRERLRRTLRHHRNLQTALAALVAVLLGAVLGGWLLAPQAAHSLAWESRISLPAAAPSTTGEMAHVSLVALPSGTDIAAIAAELGIEGVDPTSPPTWRRLYAELCAALAGQCRAVVFDLYFPTDHEFDEQFAAAVRSCLDAGTPVVAGSQRRDTDAEGKPAMSKQIWDAGVHWGYITLGGHLEAIRVPLLTDDGSRQYPSLALAGVAAMLQPRGYPSFSITEDSHIRLRFWQQSDSHRPGSRRAMADEALVLPTVVQPFDPLPPAAWLRGFRQTDVVAWQQPQLPSQAVQLESTIQLRDVLLPGDAPPVLRDKIVVVFDSARERPIPTSQGMMQPAYIHASTMDAVIAGRTLRLWTASQHFWAGALASLLGGFLGFAIVKSTQSCLRRKATRSVAAVALAAFVVLAGGAILHTVGLHLASARGQLASPAPAALSLLISVTLTIVVAAVIRRFANNRVQGALR